MRLFKFMLVLMLLAAAIVGGYELGQHKPVSFEEAKAGTQEMVNDAKSAMGNMVEEGGEFTKKTTADVVAATKTGLEKSEALTTNLANKTKSATTNAWNTMAEATTNILDKARQTLSHPAR